MPATSTAWKALYNLFDPTARLEAEDQDLFVERPGSVAESIAADLQMGLEPHGKWVVCGSMGSGKSSELVHLAGLLSDSHAVIGLDLPGSVSRVDRLRPPEVLFLVGAAAVRASKELWGHEVPKDLVEDLLLGFKGLLSDQAYSVDVASLLQGVALFTASLAAPGVGPVLGAAKGAAGIAAGLVGQRPLRHRPAQLGGMTRPVIEGEPDLARLTDAVDAILDDVRAYRPPAILVDGLDKLHDLAAIRELFTSSRVLAAPRAQVVYTGPISLMLGTEWQATGGAFKRSRLTNVVLAPPELDWVKLEEGRAEAGRATMVAVVERRLKRVRLQLDQVFAPQVLDTLIQASGGLLRDLVRLINQSVRQALQVATSQIGSEEAARAIDEVRKEYEITLNGKRVEELRYVRQHGEPSGKDQVCSDLLLGGYVLPFSNGRVWFEPHRILRGLRPGL